MDTLNTFITEDDNTTILTPNRRLAAVLSKTYQQKQLNKQKLVWQTLDCLPLQSWLHRLWQEYLIKHLSSLVLLTPEQELILWIEIIRNTPQSAHLLQINSTAKLAKAAWLLINEWELDIAHSAFSLTEDTETFKNWAKMFITLCQKRNLINTSKAVHFISKAIEQKRLSLPKKIILAGFTDLAPLYQRLLNICADTGSSIEYEKLQTKSPQLQKIALLNKTEEIRTMALWAKKTYDNSKHKKAFLIGCIIPQLDNIRDEVLTIFSEVFAKEQTLLTNQEHLPFNISVGKKLIRYPLIKTALQLLSFIKNKFELHFLHQIITSPFLGEAEKEFNARAKVSFHLKKNISHLLTLETLLHYESNYLEKKCPKLAKRIQNVLNYMKTFPKKALPSHWINFFMQTLNCLGWPGERSLNSAEYQVVQRFLNLLLECACLDQVTGAVNAEKLLHYLQVLCSELTFQQKTPEEAPIQILGVLEGAALPFENIWLMQQTDQIWPMPPAPNPFIPIILQKKYKMPHSSAVREYVYCQTLMTQMAANAKNIFLSFALKDNEVNNEPSPLLQSIPEIQLSKLAIPKYTTLARQILDSKKLNYEKDDRAPILKSDEKISAGTKIFKLQAACPFKAFAEIRLHAEPMEESGLGIKSYERGILVHKTLELIWQKIKDSTTLKKLAQEELAHLVTYYANLALEASLNFAIYNKHFLALEVARLKNIVMKWLQLELKRDSFSVIATESEKNYQLGPLTLRIRIDRIDQLENGQKILIDYKTGKYPHVKDWFSDKPDDPQLPLYCILHPEKISGIAFAKLHPDNMEWQGVTFNNAYFKELKTIEEIKYANNNWSKQIEHWQKIFTALTNAFYEGEAFVTPKKQETTCQHCQLAILCRRYEK